MDEADLSLISKKTLREQIVQMLRKRIVSGEIIAGDRINESEISKQFLISRGPVREALIQLEEEGMVTYQARKGCMVRTISYEEMQEGHMIRCTLEVLAIRMYSGKLSEEFIIQLTDNIERMKVAAEKKDIYHIIQLDEEFHSSLVKAAHSDKLYEMWRTLEGESIASYHTMNAEGLVPFSVISRNHKKILDVFCEAKSITEIVDVIEEHYMVVPQVLYEKKKMQKEGKA